MIGDPPSRREAMGQVLGLAALAAGLGAGPTGWAKGAEVGLPAAPRDGGLALSAALSRRRSLRAFGPAPIGLGALAGLLWAAQGTSDGQGRRTAPSAGATYPLELDVVAGRIQGLAPGVYRYLVPTHALRPRIDGDLREQVAVAARDQRWIVDAPAIVVIVARAQRTAQRYGQRAARYVAMESGAAAQNLLLQAVAAGLGGTVVGAFDDEALHRTLALSSDEQVMALIPVGFPR